MARMTGFQPSTSTATPIGGNQAPVVADFETSPVGSPTVEGATSSDEDDARLTLRFAVATVAGALALLWFFGGIVWRDATL